MFALYEQGIQPAEIARRCAAGLTSVAPFQIPRRTAQEIVTGMAREQGREDLPHSIEGLLEGDSAELAARYPGVVLRLINADCERLQARSATRPLSLDEYNRLRAGVAIHKQIVGQAGGSAPTRPRKHRGGRRGAQEVEGSALELLERYIEEKQPESSSHEHEHAEDVSDAASSPRIPAPTEAS